MSKPCRLAPLLNLTVVVASLGNLVDAFDMVLFPVLRQPSLAALGIPPEAQVAVGMHLLNVQMVGMLAGGVLWGILGDKRGRLSTLFGSIALYSLANLANAFVHGIPAYALCRLLAGLGLAGELGAAVTLVCETLPRESRALGTTLLAVMGALGGLLAGVAGRELPWRIAFGIGGALGLLLLTLRMRLRESALFRRAMDSDLPRGAFLSLFSSGDRLGRFLRCIALGVPSWCVMGILVTFAPEFAPHLGVSGSIVPATALLCYYVGCTLGDLSSGLLSQAMGSRRKVIALAYTLLLGVVAAYLRLRGLPPAGFYALCVCLGLGTGYWTVFITVSAEQFGTNLRSTVATSVPNLVRGSVPLITTGFLFFRDHGAGFVGAAWIVCLLGIGVAALALAGLRETHGRDLDFVE